jgi:sigma-B regulation protein RsbU (phosphoserine phosphatase)
VKLDAGDSLFLFTDGVTETMNLDGLEYGTLGLFEAIGAALDPTPTGRIQHSLSHIDGFRGSAPRHDDLTILALAYN